MREIPDGSGVNGRPIEWDGRRWVRHTAYYRAGHWWHYCDNARVDDDHACPDRGALNPNRYGSVANCYACHEAWERTR